MSTARDVVIDALSMTGINSPVNPADNSLISAGFRFLVTRLEVLREKNIILKEDNVNGVSITIRFPTELTDELFEPAASRMMLSSYMAADLPPLAQLPTSMDVLRNSKEAFARLSNMYWIDTIPNIVPSRLLSLGQGSTRTDFHRVFFGGQAIDNDKRTVDENFIGNYPTVEDAISDNENNVLSDPSFNTAGTWTIGAGWAVSGGLATRSAAAATDISQTPTITEANSYVVKIDVTTALVDDFDTRVQGGADSSLFTTAVTGIQFKTVVAGTSGTTRIAAKDALSTGVLTSFEVFRVFGSIGKNYFNTTHKRIETIQSDGTSI